MNGAQPESCALNGGSIRRLFVISAIVAAFVAGLQVHSRAAPPTEPGLMPYPPTRIEWLALDLEAFYRVQLGSNSNYMLDFYATTPSTIKIVVLYTHDADARVVDIAIERAESLVHTHASNHGWSWIKVEVERKLIPPE